MKIMIEIPEDYGRALMIMAKGTDKNSRQQLIVDLLKEVVDQNKGLLEQSRAVMNAEKSLNFNTSVRIDMPKEPEPRKKKYRFTRRDGGVLEGEGATAGKALAEAMGRTLSYEEYNAEFEKHEIIR